jgi:hypothetical protein
MLLGDLNVEAERVCIFKSAVGNDSVPEKVRILELE